MTAKNGRAPRSPLVQPAFYFARRGTEEVFFAVVDHLIDRGGRVVDVVLGEVGAVDALADPVHDRIDRVAVRGRAELDSVRASTGRVIAGVGLADVGAGSSGRDVQVRVLPIPEAAVGRDHHPIAIWCDGRAFEPGAGSTRKRAAAGVLDLFTSVVVALSPSYGAILVEWPLPCPYEVGERPDGFEFADFYLATDYVGREKLDKIAALASDRCTTLPEGTLFLTSGLFGARAESVEDIGTWAALAVVAADRA
ncbi:hypothetical protein [Saccharothrix deserti]|uniref:hypothetical protein n=1 Tax=Saccharothrix deserti TaxID=2593674 RepID=UPI00131EC582|nr:hypothetical protein [Saccharothrix deserti]